MTSLRGQSEPRVSLTGLTAPSQGLDLDSVPSVMTEALRAVDTSSSPTATIGA